MATLTTPYPWMLVAGFAVWIVPEHWLPEYGDPVADSIAAGLRARARVEGDPFSSPARVPEVINRECSVDEAPRGLRDVHKRAVALGWDARVTHGRGWGISRGKPGHRLLDSYALRLAITGLEGREMRAYGMWVNGQAQNGGWLALPERVGGSLSITRLGEVINSVGIRQSDVAA